MTRYIRRGLNSPTNNLVKEDTPPEQLRNGTPGEIAITGNTPFPTDGYLDGYSKFIPEGTMEASDAVDTTGQQVDKCPPSSDFRGYHKTTLTDFFRGTDIDGKCPSPYSRFVLNGRGFNSVIEDREAQLIMTTGRRVLLLRREFNGIRCPCYDTNRGRSRGKCDICYGTSFVPGYIPYVAKDDPLGRIPVRFSPYTEDTPVKEQGTFQEVTIQCWTLSAPIVRKRDVIIVYNTDGSEEYRYEILTVERNDVFSNGVQGAQKFQVKRIDPTQTIYNYDPLKIPDLANVVIDVSDTNPQGFMAYNELGPTVQEDAFTKIAIEAVYGDGAFSGMFAEGYKLGYELNFRRTLLFQLPMWAPDFNEDGTVDDGYGEAAFFATTGQTIKFSTPQVIQDNTGVNPLEVIAAEKKRFFVEGFLTGAKHGVLDGENELRVRGFL